MLIALDPQQRDAMNEYTNSLHLLLHNAIDTPLHGILNDLHALLHHALGCHLPLHIVIPLHPLAAMCNQQCPA